MLKKREDFDIYLTHACRHHHSIENREIYSRDRTSTSSLNKNSKHYILYHGTGTIKIST